MVPTPKALIAEVTHRCPLHCVYCSNPLELQLRENELAAGEWARVFDEAAKLGVLQLHLTGGEPLSRPDLVQLIEAGRRARLYVNLITSGVGLTEDRLRQLVDAGLDHFQLSLQDSDEAMANEIAGTRAYALKLRVAEWVRRQPIAFTVNLVVHRNNLDRLESLIAFAEQTGTNRLEIANVQYYGWALLNRSALLPTREQLQKSLAVVEAARERLGNRLRIEFVMPDYYARYPKPCMGGWGNNLLLLDPAGQAMPCHAAAVIPGLTFPNVREHGLDWIWNSSDCFNKFRGDDWMQEPCRSCERKSRDFGGCRCQALLLTGDAERTDPVCTLTPDRQIVDRILASANDAPAAPTSSAAQPWIYRIEAAPANPKQGSERSRDLAGISSD
jgi:pyrroloquinoline quinone biosynthesis protein E